MAVKPVWKPPSPVFRPTPRAGGDGWENPAVCWSLPPEICTSVPGCEISHRSRKCGPRVGTVKDLPSAKRAVDRAVDIIETAPDAEFPRAWRKVVYLTRTLPYSPSWEGVPSNVKRYLLTTGWDRVRQAYCKERYRRKLGPTRACPIS